MKLLEFTSQMKDLLERAERLQDNIHQLKHVTGNPKCVVFEWDSRSVVLPTLTLPEMEGIRRELIRAAEASLDHIISCIEQLKKEQIDEQERE